MNHILSIKNLSFFYGANEALSDISFSVEKGNYVAMCGPNGAGKTTLINVILGLEKATKGYVELFGQDLKDFHDQGRIGFLPQQAYAFNPLFPATVKEVVAMGLLSRKKIPKAFTPTDTAHVHEALERMSILDLRDEPIGSLSGGQQQRVFLARALVSNPELLILDEPSTALDPQAREQFYDLIASLNKTQGMTILLITHDPSTAGQFADHLLYLDKRVVFYGAFDDFCNSKDMGKYFGSFSQHLICHQHT